MFLFACVFFCLVNYFETVAIATDKYSMRDVSSVFLSTGLSSVLDILSSRAISDGFSAQREIPAN